MPLPLGEVSPQVTERASLSPESRRTVIGGPFVRVILSSGLYFAVSILALSVSHTLDSSPSRGASGETGNFAGTAKASPTRGGGIAKQ